MNVIVKPFFRFYPVSPETWLYKAICPLCKQYPTGNIGEYLTVVTPKLAATNFETGFYMLNLKLLNILLDFSCNMCSTADVCPVKCRQTLLRHTCCQVKNGLRYFPVLFQFRKHSSPAHGHSDRYIPEMVNI